VTCAVVKPNLLNLDNSRQFAICNRLNFPDEVVVHLTVVLAIL